VQDYPRREKLLWVLNRISTSAALRNYFLCACGSHSLRYVYPELTEEDVSLVDTMLKSGYPPSSFDTALNDLEIRR